MSLPVYVGIDPGMSGGIAWIVDGVATACPMPETERDVLDVLFNAGWGNVNRFAVLEHVSASPLMGVVSAFKFGGSYFGLRMALTASGFSFDEVSPARWQKMLGCLSKGDKNVTKRRAQQLFPHVTVTHAVADALLLVEYCRRARTGELVVPDTQTIVPNPKRPHILSRKKSPKTKPSGDLF